MIALDRRRSTGALLFAVALTALAGTLGSLGHLAWWLELFTHFRPQYALLLTAGGIGLMVLGRLGVGFAALALAAANALPMLSYYVAPPVQAGGGPEIKVVLSNVYFRNGDHDRLLDYIGRLKPDVAVFLEVTPEWREALQSLSGTLPYQAHAGEVFVASTRPLAGLNALPLPGTGEMAVAFSLDSDAGRVTIVGAHADWPLGAAIAANRNLELASLAEIARSLPGPVLLLADLNATAFSPVFNALLVRSGLADCAAGHGFHPTWPAWFPPLYMQIDHCLAGPGLVVTGFNTGPYVGSDHYPLEVTLRLQGVTSSDGHGVSASLGPPTSRR